MNPRLFIDIDPRLLRLPPSRLTGADPAKLHRQIARFGTSLMEMPPLEVYKCTDGELMVYDGVTRATRAAKFQPGCLITIEIVDDLPHPGRHLPTIESKLP